MDEHFAAVKALRDRQAAYLDSLPTDPKEAIKAARAIMTPDFEPYPEGVKEALYLSVALESLVNGEGIEGRGLDRDAARFIANRVSTAMFNVMKDLDRLSDVLENPSRFERLE
ncbi:hypothetical protein [Pseudoprimorskyibacter insulae]|uniref:hypothetical protein n=1 Tax=Pseudoprimorskyibacter insulae TaxID=1695997 RepID=UPI0011B20FEA|nr:hypothetical protein [Pseudoprimorskyibacter insulae]